MSRILCITGLLGVLVSTSVLASASVPSPAEQFILDLISEVAQGSSCRNTFDPRPAVHFFEESAGYGPMKTWQEPDRREPDVTNYMVQWSFPGFELTTSSHFGYYGVSTWLDSVRVTAPTKLPDPLSFDMPVRDLVSVLGNSDKKGRADQISYQSAYLSFGVDENDRLLFLFLECIAD